MIWAAFLLGLGGSLHCAAMCGPLVLSVHYRWNIKGVNLPIIIYHTGRIAGYLLLGLAMAMIKVPMHLFNVQQYVALITGILLIIFVLKNRIPGVRQLFGGISSGLSKTMSRYYGKQNALPFVGFLNGLLPCGLSYGAAILSVGQPTIEQGLLYMLFFGLGTLPMFLVGAYLGKKFEWSFFKRVNKYINYALLLVGLLLILRGSGLDIPYISPAMDVETEELNCCH